MLNDWRQFSVVVIWTATTINFCSHIDNSRSRQARSGEITNHHIHKTYFGNRSMSRSDIADFGKQCKMPTVITGLQPRVPNPSTIGAGYWAFLRLQPILLQSVSTSVQRSACTNIEIKTFKFASKLAPSRKQRKAYISFVISGRLHVCINMLPTGRISMTFDTVDFYENLQRNSKLVKIRQKYRSLYMKT